MYTIEEFDKQKTKVLKYIIYKKRSEQEVRKKFENTIEPQLLEDIIDDKEYIEKTINNFTILKNLSITQIKYKLYAKGLNKNDIEDYIYEHEEELEEYETKSALNIISKKLVSMELEEVKQYLIKKGYKQNNINKAIEQLEE